MKFNLRVAVFSLFMLAMLNLNFACFCNAQNSNTVDKQADIEQQRGQVKKQIHKQQ